MPTLTRAWSCLALALAACTSAPPPGAATSPELQPPELEPVNTEFPAGAHLRFDATPQASWAPDEPRDSSLEAWLGDAWLERPPVLERRDRWVRVAVESLGVELWPWVDSLAAATVLVGPTGLAAAPGRAPFAQLAGGVEAEPLETRGAHERVEVAVKIGQTRVTVTGWIPRDRLGTYFSTEPLPHPRGRPLELDVEPGETLELLETPEGPVVGRVDQDMTLLEVHAGGEPVDGMMPIEIDLRLGDEHYALVSGYVPVDQVREWDDAGLSMTIGLGAPAGPTIAAGRCLHRIGDPRPIGVTTEAVARTTQDEPDTLVLGELYLIAGEPCERPGAPASP